MRQYLDLLQDVLENGIDHPDRTGVGRRSVFGRQLRFNLEEGFPLVTTKKLDIKGFICELLWFISGDADIKYLNDNNVHIWDNWAVKESDIDKFLEETIIDVGTQIHPAFLKQAKAKLMETYLGTIGPVYGPSWRNAPISNNPQSSQLSSKRREFRFDQLASDKQRYLTEQHTLITLDTQNKLNDSNLSEEDKVQLEVHLDILSKGVENTFNSKIFRLPSIDQLQDVIINLKSKPYSARHIISAWIPEWLPSEDKSPQSNVLYGGGALAPCPVLQQYFVQPSKYEGGKKRLSLQVYIR